MSVIDSEFIYKLSVYSDVIVWLSIASCVTVFLVMKSSLSRTHPSLEVAASGTPWRKIHRDWKIMLHVEKRQASTVGQISLHNIQ